MLLLLMKILLSRLIWKNNSKVANFFICYSQFQLKLTYFLFLNMTFQIGYLYFLYLQYTLQQFLSFMIENSLKRNLFAQSIRVEQREKKMKEIRDRFLEQQKQQKQYYNENQFRKIRTDCKQSNYNKNALTKTVQYLITRRINASFGTDLNMRFINELTQNIQEKYKGEQQAYLITGIKNKLQELIELQILYSIKDQKGNIIDSRQLSELKIFHRCFDEFLKLIEEKRCYTELWIAFSKLKNKDLKKYGLLNFERFVMENLQTLSSLEISIIASSISGFREDCKEEEHKFIGLIDAIMAKYHLSPFDAIKLIDPLLQVLSEPNLHNKIDFITETNLIENITNYLDKTKDEQYKKNSDLAGKAGYFLAKLFSVEDERLCSKVYMKSVMMLSYIRSWLPIKPNVTIPMLEHLGGCSLEHLNHRCTSYLIFALTNIVASDFGFVESILIKTDIYRALIYIYKLVPINCRDEISIFIFNICSKSDSGTLRIMLESKLVQTITEMLKQQSDIILNKALSSITLICRSLESHSQKQNSQWVYTLNRFQIQLESLGGFKMLQALVNYPNEEISSKAAAVLECFY